MHCKKLFSCGFRLKKINLAVREIFLSFKLKYIISRMKKIKRTGEKRETILHKEFKERAESLKKPLEKSPIPK